MTGKWSFVVSLALALAFLGAGTAAAKEQYVYSVKFVCGFNNSNVGTVFNPDGTVKAGGEPPVKFGNYATEINIIWPEIYIEGPAFVFKHLMVLVDRGIPVGREPRVVSSLPYADSVRLGSLQGTMDDCNRIAELLWGAVPTPFPLTIGYLTITSTHELDVTAVYTAEVETRWLLSTSMFEGFNPLAEPQGVGVSIDVEKVAGRKLVLP